MLKWQRKCRTPNSQKGRFGIRKLVRAGPDNSTTAPYTHAAGPQERVRKGLLVMQQNMQQNNAATPEWSNLPWEGEHDLHNRQQDMCSRHVAEKVAPTRTARIALARRGKDHICDKICSTQCSAGLEESDISAGSALSTRAAALV